MTTKTVLNVVVAGLLAVVCASAAFANPVDKRTTFHFTGPVAVPGVTLPAGAYLFRLADSHTRDVVQVLSADGRTPYAMFFAVRRWRSVPAAEPEVRFLETAADMPRALESWWYPNETLGYEFIYPREQARLLAEGAGQPVLTGPMPGDFIEPDLTWTLPIEEEVVRMEPPMLAGKVLTGELTHVAPPAAGEPVPVLPRTDSATTTWFALMVLFVTGWAAFHYHNHSEHHVRR